jgi:methionine synthase II (cobalamin-independent)
VAKARSAGINVVMVTGKLFFYWFLNDFKKIKKGIKFCEWKKYYKNI